jgi:hypothetical protein
VEEYETFLGTLQISLGLSGEQLEALPSFLLRSRQLEQDYQAEIGQLLGALAKLRHALVDSDDPVHKRTIDNPRQIDNARKRRRIGDYPMVS